MKQSHQKVISVVIFQANLPLMIDHFRIMGPYCFPHFRNLYKKATQEVLATEAGYGRDFELCIEEEEAKIGRMTFFYSKC